MRGDAAAGASEPVPPPAGLTAVRILSARIHRARRDRAAGTVAAVVALTALRGGTPVRAFVAVSVPARSAGAAPLRNRLLGAAKLAFAARPMVLSPQAERARAA